MGSELEEGLKGSRRQGRGREGSPSPYGSPRLVGAPLLCSLALCCWAGQRPKVALCQRPAPPCCFPGLPVPPPHSGPAHLSPRGETQLRSLHDLCRRAGRAEAQTLREGPGKAMRWQGSDACTSPGTPGTASRDLKSCSRPGTGAAWGLPEKPALKPAP